MEYSHFRSILFFGQTMILVVASRDTCILDTDEFFFCPQPSPSLSYIEQSRYQHEAIERNIRRGVQEMRFVVLPYSAHYNSTLQSIKACLSSGYVSENITEMFRCWTARTNYDDFPKSADLAVLFSSCFDYISFYFNRVCALFITTIGNVGMGNTYRMMLIG